MKPAVLLAALALTIPIAEAQAAGFSTTVLARDVAPRDQVAARAAMARMQAVRASFVTGGGSARWLDPMETRVLSGAAGQLDGPGGAGFAWFMRGATLRIGAGPGGPVAGFYNPLVDAWLIARLQRIDGEYRIVDARLELSASAADWTAGASPFVALAGAYGGALSAFDARFAVGRGNPAPAPDAFDAVSRRTVAWMTALGRWRAGRAQAAAAAAAVSMMAQGRTGALGLASPALTAQVDGLPLTVRRTLAVTAAVERGDVTSLLILSPVRPDLILVLDLDSGSRPNGLHVLNLANAVPGDDR